MRVTLKDIRERLFYLNSILGKAGWQIFFSRRNGYKALDLWNTDKKGNGEDNKGRINFFIMSSGD